MKKEFSIYLDVLRFLSALAVYLHHLNLRSISAEKIPFGNIADFGVLTFFLMSGCVIAFVAQCKERTLGQYAASRAARIYSVALPVILVTPLLDLAGRALDASWYAGHPSDHAAARMLISALFANEIWGWSVLLFSNGPYWSLSYEISYYVAFGLFFYVASRWRYLAILLLALMAGPKIVLLAPIWCAGVWLYRLDSSKFLSPRASGALAISACAAGALYISTPLQHLFAQIVLRAAGPELQRELSHSQNFLGNYVLAAIVFLHLLGMKQFSSTIRIPLIRYEKPIRRIASYTFALYLFHQPLIYLWASLIQGDNAGYRFALAISAGVAVSIWIAGYLTESLRIAIKDCLARRFGARAA